ncbi:hypothetical protein GCT13_47820 [Paraburkholderia sp. CNPSo 3157]|uniref:Pirin N-terminal domain-containing protein n=1 Tax=Paraburkholderia franconis TaxID=2654983 RepID=A0A7X1TM20_9BURK|nr:hypothetical protein [Paraburkholderia franconis]
MPGPIKTILTPRESDIGNLVVRRVLPARAARLVGPFIFFDHMGPAVLPAGVGVDVRPHPHIGLATVTYLFEGSLMHRDSLGFEQKIVPGDVNWMTAGRGIVHSERTPNEDRPERQTMHGIQTWVALPVDHEDAQPGFMHEGRNRGFVAADGGGIVRLLERMRGARPRSRARLVEQRAGVRPAFVLGRARLRVLGGLT